MNETVIREAVEKSAPYCVDMITMLYCIDCGSIQKSDIQILF